MGIREPGGNRLRGHFRALWLALALWLLPQAVAAACAPGAVDVRGDWGQVRFAVEVARTQAQQAQGLMHREHMPLMAGMLFVYPRPQRTSFWMKNTLIPLDMVFADTRGVITHIHENATPGDLTPIPSEGPVLAVLEVNGGLARRLGLRPGDQMRHPAFPAGDAVWPCE